MITVGSHTIYSRLVPATKKIAEHVDEFPAIVVGLEPPDKVHLAYLNPDKVALLGGADWRDAFDRIVSVPQGDSKGLFHAHQPAAPNDDALVAENKQLKAMLSTAEETQNQVNGLEDVLKSKFPDAVKPGESSVACAARLLKSKKGW